MENEKIDRRIHYILMIDTETANGLDDPFVYDFGCAVIDTHGNVYETRSFVNADIYLDEKALMATAYYAEKLPQYEKDIADGKRVLKSLWNIRKEVHALIDKYHIQEACAHNAIFDNRSLNTTMRYVYKSKFRYFLPRGVRWFDTLSMARDTICKQKNYRAFCERNGYTYGNNRLRMTAEVIYQYIRAGTDFREAHTGLEDVLIEAQILEHCYRQHKPMRKYLW